jgi:hypothetical protein
VAHLQALLAALPGQQQHHEQQQHQQPGHAGAGAGAGAGEGDARRAARRLALARQALQQMAQVAELYAPYTFYGCSFSSDNVQRLWASLTAEEQRVFGFDLSGLEWEGYLRRVHIPGLLRYVLKGRHG